ncbi:MAG: hypothetical protein LC803_10715 [Acidobacteria bacterium]|nr:hypothetical protein [Acidobacteriota bacterium]
MKVLKLFAITLFVSLLLTSLALTPAVRSQSGATEAPANYDNQTNGFTPQGDPNTPGTFLGDKAAFENRDTVETGLGPVYNAQSCAECHQNPVTGGVSQIFELRVGRNGPDGQFVAPPGGSLIQARATNAQIQERVPDGARIVFRGASARISVMGFDGGQYGPVGNTTIQGFQPSFSPDGKQIVFGRRAGTGSNTAIMVINDDGTNLRQITATGVQDSGPTWSPDGTKIAFQTNRTGLRQIFTMNPDGSNQTRISDGLSNDTLPAWSPDGTKIAFTKTPLGLNMTSDVWLFNPDGSGQMPLTLTPTSNDTFPTWSPDSTMIAFQTDRDGNWEIYKMTSAGAIQTRLTNHAAADTDPTWSPDGSLIAFTSDRNSSTNSIWSIAADGSSPTRLTTGLGENPSFSNDQGETVRTFRASLNILGDGFVEATDDGTFLAIRDAQPFAMRGTAIFVPILESPGCDPSVPSTCEHRLGRFSWKNSVASLLSFSAGAYRLEQGITSPLQPNEDTSLGREVTLFDPILGLEDTGGILGFGEDVEAFARFMRSTKTPPRDRALVPDDATDPGSQLFDTINCSVCHVRSITTTANPSTTFNGGTFTVGTALANKVYHPFGDFLLHDIGTGDGIVETNGEMTRNLVRTAPLWGLRTRDRLMHDGGSSSPPTNQGDQSFTLNEAIMRHGGQATSSRAAYQSLTPQQKAQLIRFLKSL